MLVQAFHQGLGVDQNRHVDRSGPPDALAFRQREQCQCPEMVLLLQRIGRACRRCGVVKQGFECVAQPIVEERTRFRVELSTHAPHTRLAIDPRAQPRGAALPFESGKAIVGLCPANLGTQRAPELGRGGPRGDFGEELTATGQPLLRRRVEAGDALGQHIDMIDVDRSCGQRSAELGEQLDCLSPSKWLKGLSESDPRCVGDDLFGKASLGPAGRAR